MDRMINTKINLRERELAEAAPGTRERVDALNRLAWELWTTDPDRSTEYTKESLVLSEKLAYDEGFAFARLNRGIMSWRTDVETALPDLLAAQDWFQRNNHGEGEAHACNFLGILYWGIGEFERGFELSSRAIRLYSENGMEDGEAWAINTMGGFYYDLKNYEKSLEYFKQALAVFERLENIVGIARSLNGIGNTHFQMGRCKRALVYQKQSLKITREIGHEFNESRVLNDIGLIYQQFDDFKTAEKYHLDSLKIRKKLEYFVGQATTLLDLGDLYKKRNICDAAMDAYQQGLQISLRIKAKPKMARAYKALADNYEMTGNYQLALENWKAFHELEEEIFHEDTEKKIRNLRKAYELESSQKEAEIYRLRNVELKENNDKLEETIKMLNATQAQLIQSGRMAALGNLVAGIVHEINSPVGSIRSGSDVLRRISDKLMALLQASHVNETLRLESEKSLKILAQTTENNRTASDRIMKLVQSLKNFVRIDQAAFQKVDIHEGLENTLNLIGYDIPQSMKIEKNFGEIPTVHIFPDQMNQVFMNLLINAVQATPQDGKITIETKIKDGHVVICISDTGKGIPPEKLANLFEPGFSNERERVKMRTGLYSSYQIIQKHNGNIHVESKAGEGTTFTIHIPVDLHQQLNGKAKAAS